MWYFSLSIHQAQNYSALEIPIIYLIATIFKNEKKYLFIFKRFLCQKYGFEMILKKLLCSQQIIHLQIILFRTMNAKLKNSSNNLMVLQEQFNHQKRLNQIYAKRPSITNLVSSVVIPSKHGNTKKQKMKEYVTQKHLRNIQKLVQNITQQRSILQRQKDRNDFFAYPALFFRQVTIPLKKTKSQRNLKAKPTQFKESSEKTPNISLQQIKQFLPILHNFEQQDLQQWLDGVNKLIITFNIMQKDQLVDLSQKIMSLLPKKCPEDFRSAVQHQLLDICRQA